MAKFKHLDVPFQWKEEFTKYPHGYTIFESLCNWTTQVDVMVDNVNEWNKYLDDFVGNFEFELQKEVQETIIDWQNKGLLEEIISGAVDIQIDTIKEDIEDVKNMVKGIEVNIKNFGAVGDGVSEDTQSLIDALGSIKDTGGKIVIPEGVYNINGIIEIYDNVHISLEKNAILAPKVETLCFWLPSYGKGYDGGVKNVTVSGGRIKGDFISGIYFTFACHHSKNIVIKDMIFEQCQYTGHVIDLCGCSNITVENITVYGVNPPSEKPYTEAIQIDRSVEQALSYRNPIDISNLDGLMTKEVVIKNCKFLPIRNNQGVVVYYAPCPVGSHSYDTNYNYEDIAFKDNYIEEPITNTHEHYHGVVHLQLIKNLIIEGNTFISKQGTENTVISVNDLLGPAGEDRKKSANIIIRRNIIRGFNTELGPLIRIQGLKSTHLIPNVSITQNTLLINKSTKDCVLVNYVRDIEIVDNYIENYSRCVYYGTCGDIIVRGNTLVDGGKSAIYCPSSAVLNTLSLVGNTILNGNGLGMFYGVKTLTFVANIVDNLGTDTSVSGQTPFITHAENLMVQNNSVSTRLTINHFIFYGTPPNKAIITQNILDTFNNAVNSPQEGDIIENNI